MKYLAIILLLLATSKAGQAQQLVLDTPIPQLYFITDTTGASLGKINSTVAITKKFGYIVYTNVKDTLNPGLLTFFYLDANKKLLDKKYYVFPFTITIK